MKTFIKLPARTAMALMLMLTSICALAQVRVQGLVVDPQHEPIIGATVRVKGTSVGTATDIDGKFSLDVPSKTSVLQISYVGYLPAEVQAGAPEVTSGIELKENNEVLDEVVVIGYGRVKKSDATGSVTAVKPDDFNKGNRTSVQEAMVGKIPRCERCYQFGRSRCRRHGAYPLRRFAFSFKRPPFRCRRCAYRQLLD